MHGETVKLTSYMFRPRRGLI